MAQTVLGSLWRTTWMNHMLEMTQLLSGSKGPAKTAESANSDPAELLHALLHGDGLTMDGFSAEIHGLLMQLPPQVMQRLEQMLGSGMSLPQAANSVLSQQFADDGAPGFAALLQGGRDEAPAWVAPKMPLNGPDGLPALPPAVSVRTGPPAAGVLPSIDIATATAPSTSGHAASQPAGHLPPQLAGSLLQMGVPQQVGSRAWQGAMADRVMWMIQGEQQVAKLKLNPPNLGPLEVRVTVHQDQTSVAFLSQHAAVREALEAALPRLREMFDQQQLQLVRADVSDPGAQQGDPAREFARRNPGQFGADTETGGDPLESAAGQASSVAQGVGIVDVFA